uniref:U3 small nucleolar ribonucleoprotein protein MPP10 n=1 Tax=Evadne anonyx TaxID=141404 RepID=A0A9N6WQ92_9CRUS|nr:EOG090X09DZ [Evadne anonyx]
MTSTASTCCVTMAQVCKQLYDYRQQNFPVKGCSGGLPELYTEGFVEDQIWEQIQLHNEPVYNILMKNASKILSQKNYLSFVKKTQEKSTENDEEVEKDEESSSGGLSDVPDVSDEADSDTDIDETHLLKFDEYKVLDEDDGPEPAEKNEPKKHKRSEVDDDFFKLGEMEDFLQKEEGKQMKGEDGGDIDLFEEVPSDDEDQADAITAKYSDFFKGSMLEESHKKKRVRDNDDPDADDDEDDKEMEGSDFSGGDSSSDDEDVAKPEVKSSFEQRQERLKSRIENLEEEAIGPKPWQLRGEAHADVRPPNALLEEDLYFEHTSRVAPVITEETTKTLEDIIKQRIKDQAFDDVVRKVKPVYDPAEYKKKLVLNQEKSKFSLAEIYEQEYLKTQEEAEQTPEASSLADPLQNKESDDKAHAVIRKMMDDVFAKLDALSNFYYTPKIPVPEIKIVSNMPSIVMEEIAPVTVSDATLLAPEEVQNRMRAVEMTSAEKEKTDRLRERRKKKKDQRIRHKEKERLEKLVDKANPGLGNKHAKDNALRKLEQAEKEGTVTLIKDDKNKAVKSSTAFFNQLQENVANELKNAKAGKPKKLNDKRVSASKLKL